MVMHAYAQEKEIIKVLPKSKRSSLIFSNKVGNEKKKKNKKKKQYTPLNTLYTIRYSGGLNKSASF